jgi:hypothetical protein
MAFPTNKDHVRTCSSLRWSFITCHQQITGEQALHMLHVLSPPPALPWMLCSVENPGPRRADRGYAGDGYALIDAAHTALGI